MLSSSAHYPSTDSTISMLTSPCDFGPRYFVPLPSSGLPDLIEKGEACAEDWLPGCTEYEDFGCDAFHDACTDCAGLLRPMGPPTPTPSTINPTGLWSMSPPLVSVAILELTKARFLRRRDELPFFEGYLPHNNPGFLADPPVFMGELPTVTRTSPYHT